MLKTSLMVQVLQKSFRCICKDGKVMNLSYESQELRDLILCQVRIVDSSLLIKKIVELAIYGRSFPIGVSSPDVWCAANSQVYGMAITR